MEEETFVHVFHKHPLSLIPLDSTHEIKYNSYCYGCWRYFLPGDATYGCSRQCGFNGLLHKECMEMPQEIMHPIHPSHHLTLHDSEEISGSKICAVCEGYACGLTYRCSQGDCGGFLIHLECAAGFLKDKQPSMEHPSHPQHKLRFSRKTRWCPFPCDACGATEKGDSYTCTVSDYCIHESCALLPLSKDFPRLHPAHSLSLAFHLPNEYIKYDFDCAICNTTLSLTCWVYHCHLCRYVVHLNCATSTFDNENESESATNDDEKEVIKFPIARDDMYEEMIRPFVKGQICIPHHDHDNRSIGAKYNFSNHTHHLLTFTAFSASSSSSHDHYEKMMMMTMTLTVFQDGD